MTISRHLESIICSAKSKSPVRNLCQGKELQNRCEEDGLNICKFFNILAFETPSGKLKVI